MSVKNILKVSEGKRNYIRASAYLYLPLILILLILRDKYFSWIPQWVEIVFCVVLPLCFFAIPYLNVTRQKCPKCENFFFKSNPFSKNFGTDLKCKKCGYPSEVALKEMVP